MRRWRFLAVISAAQLALLFAHPGRGSLWLDEVTSADVAGAPWGRVWAFFRSLPEQHPLYYLLLRGWTILGTSEATLRSLSVVLAIATVWALYALVGRLAGERTAWVAAVIAAASPYLLYYGQEARMYALLAFLTVANGYWFLVWHDTDARPLVVGGKRAPPGRRLGGVGEVGGRGVARAVAGGGGAGEGAGRTVRAVWAGRADGRGAARLAGRRRDG